MIRMPTADGWLLITHPDHARLAGQFADCWGNADFPRPEPWRHVREAVYAHDDGWIARDAAPQLTRAGLPSAFTRELVGRYAAFEEIDLADYLAVRGQALEAIARRDAYAGILISRHTVNLLTEQADVSTIRAADRPLHARFIDGQREQQLAAAAVLTADPVTAPHVGEAAFDRGFRFLQCCDSFSLMACTAYDEPRPLRHAQERADGALVSIICTPRGEGVFALSPWPLGGDEVAFTVPCRRVQGREFASLEAFQRALAVAPAELMTVRVVRG